MDNEPVSNPETMSLSELMVRFDQSEADANAGRVVPAEDVLRRLREATKRMQARHEAAATDPL